MTGQDYEDLGRLFLRLVEETPVGVSLIVHVGEDRVLELDACMETDAPTDTFTDWQVEGFESLPTLIRHGLAEHRKRNPK